MPPAALAYIVPMAAQQMPTTAAVAAITPKIQAMESTPMVSKSCSSNRGERDSAPHICGEGKLESPLPIPC